MAKATFAAGCFWGVEDAFRQVKGVTSTAVGYIGGTPRIRLTRRSARNDRPRRGGRGRIRSPAGFLPRAAGRVLSEPRSHQLNRQGPDYGTQYRSAIFFHDAEQEAEAREAKAALEKAGIFKRPIVTQIVPAPNSTAPRNTTSNILRSRASSAAILLEEVALRRVRAR